MKTGGRQSGFTLVEMLVALGAMAIIAGAGVALTQFAVGSSEAIAQHRESSRDLLRLGAALRSDLTQAATRRPRTDSGVKPQAALSGASTAADGVFLTLVRRGWDNPTGQDRSSLQYVEYRLAEGRIERLHRRHVDAAPMEAPLVLLSGVRSVEISYFQFDQWVPLFSGNPQRPLPRAVGVEVELEDGRVRQNFLLPEAGP